MNRLTAQPVLDLDDDAGEPAQVPPVPAERNGMASHLPTPPYLARMALPKPAHAAESDEQPERYLISLCLSYSDTVMAECESAGIAASSFFDRDCGLVYRHMRDIWKEHGEVDTALLAESLKLSGDFAKIGGWGGIGLLSGMVPTTINAPALIDAVRTGAMRRKLIEITARAASEAHTTRDPAESAAELLVRLQAIGSGQGKATRFRPSPITAYRYPESNDPNILLGSDDYLGRGGGMLFVSHAGAGKSSWIMDGCMTWALGQPWMGIKPNGKLRSLIVQAEDSDRYIGKISASFAHVHSLDDETAHEVGERCQIVRVKGVSGANFFNELRLLIAETKPDLVIINPIYLYAEGDIGRSEFTQPFLLALDALNKDEKFAYILIHHTGKPQAKGKDGKRAEVEDWESAYMGFGSSYLANWPRCTALLEPVSGKAGSYMIKLGKGGLNAGVTKKVPQGAGFRDEATTRICIKHSARRLPTGKPVYYWEPDTDTDAPDTESGQSRGAGGRTKQYTIGQFTSFMPRSRETALTRQMLYKYAKDMLGEISESTLRNVLNDAVDAKVAFRAMEGAGFVYWMNPQDGDPALKTVPQVNF